MTHVLENIDQSSQLEIGYTKFGETEIYYSESLFLLWD